MTWATQDPESFRQSLRTWLDTHCPQAMRDGLNTEATICWGGKNWQFTSEDQKLWMQNAAGVGLTTPRWSTAYGGAGLSREQEKIYLEELARINARMPLLSFGTWMLGPALLAFGSEAQKQKYLPQIIRGERRWCQGYSEPGAGSDLTNVQTKAEDIGDHYLINGQKIWTSYADKADWIFALVRTDRDAPKHKGISFILTDMQAEGVSTRPIQLISGASAFCETFFDNIKVPKENVVGEVNKGWDIAKYLLTHEREMISGNNQGLTLGRPLGAVLAQTAGEERLPDASLRAAAMECEIDALSVGLTLERYKDQAEAGAGVGDASAMLKYMGTELNKRRYELMMSAGGSEALDTDGAHGDLAMDWLRSKANSIEGGTSEVMLGIISRRILGLPG